MRLTLNIMSQNGCKNNTFLSHNYLNKTVTIIISHYTSYINNVLFIAIINIICIVSPADFVLTPQIQA